MDERIRLVIEAANRTAPTFQAVTRGMGTIGTGAKAAGEAVGRAAVNMRNTLTTVGHACQQAGAAFIRMGQTAKAGLDAIAGPLKNVATGLAGLGAAGGAVLTAFGALGVKSNQFKENTLSALTGILKSKAAAQDLYQFLSKFSDSTPFDDEEVISAGKALLTFGFDAKQMMTLVGDAAFAMKVPLEQVVGALAKLRAGTFDMSEMAPVGITREGLESKGQKFSVSGEPENRGALLGQGIALLQEKFGGGMAAGATGFDAAFSTMEANFRRIAQMASSGLFESLKVSFNAVSDAFVRFLETGKGLGGLKVILDGVGKAAELVGKAGLGVVEWLDQVISREGVAVFLSNILGLLQTIGESVLKTFGVDLKAAMDPKNVTGFFDALGVAADQGISTFFGIGRVAVEVVRITMSAFEDLGDHVSDIVSDVTRGMKSLFIGLQIQMAEMTAGALDNIAGILLGLSRIKLDWGFGSWSPMAHLADTAEDMRIQSRGMYDRGGQIQQLLGQQGALASEGASAFNERQARAQQRLAADPFRKDDIFKRIGDAFTGTNRPGGAEADFRKLLQRNILGVAKALFAGSASTAPAIPFPAAPQLYGGMQRQGPSVQILRSNVPQIPSYPGALPPTDDFTANYIARRDHPELFLQQPQLMGPDEDGNYPDYLPPQANQRGGQMDLLQPYGQEQAMLSPRQVGPARESRGQLSATFNFVFSNAEELRRQVWQVVDEMTRQAVPGPSSF